MKAAVFLTGSAVLSLGVLSAGALNLNRLDGGRSAWRQRASSSSRSSGLHFSRGRGEANARPELVLLRKCVPRGAPASSASFARARCCTSGWARSCRLTSSASAGTPRLFRSVSTAAWTATWPRALLAAFRSALPALLGLRGAACPVPPRGGPETTEELVERG